MNLCNRLIALPLIAEPLIAQTSTDSAARSMDGHVIQIIHGHRSLLAL